jgi:predicted DNA-binding protein with PD1-like motif
MFNNPPTCPETFKGDIPGGIHVRCTRPAGHLDTGHEFAGTIFRDGHQVHIHVVWGEPDEAS